MLEPGIVHGFAYWIDILSKIATSAGFVVALWVGWLGLQTYRSSVRNASNALIHSLFKDYLSFRWQFSVQMEKDNKSGDGGDDETLPEQLAGMKLYVLEEMHSWVSRERNALRRMKTAYMFNRKEYLHRLSSIDAWDSTIRTHLFEHHDAIKSSVCGWTTCYNVEFLRFLANAWNDPEMHALVATQEQAVLLETPRPLGSREKLLFRRGK